MKKILLALLMVVAISVSVEFPFAIGSRSAVAQGTVVTINVPMTWERSRESDTISEAAIGSGIDVALRLQTYAGNVWDNGTYTPSINLNAVPPGYQWTSWPQKYEIDARHFKATFNFPSDLDPASVQGMLIDPHYDTDIIPINDNLYVYLNGTRRFVGGTNYGAPNGGTNGRSNIANETDGWYIPGGVTIAGFRQGINVLDIIAEERARWGGMGYLVLRLGPRGLSPDGRIVAPSDGTTIGPSTLMITAEAWDRSGSGLKQVEFHVFYDGVWHNAGVDQTSPYQTTWQTPNQLHSQLLRFAVHVLDNSGNKAMYAGGARTVNYIESIDNSGTSENWVPFRTYLNQRSLTPEGDSKCSVASMAMILAMNGVISADYNSLRDKANEMYPRVLVNGTAYVNKMTEELTRQGVSASFSPGPIDQGQGWQTIRQEIDAGRPVIVRTTHGVVTSQGHFIVAVGYREVNETRQIIAYDPFGKWNGTCCIGNYDTNSTDPESRKGRWVYYDFNRVFGATNWLITARPSNQGAQLMRNANASLTSPDSTSDEPETIGTYIGVRTGVSRQVFLPLIKR